MEKKNSVKKNLIYQTIYQILNTCIPLITSPYLARTLGAKKQGVFSYTQSIVNYFTLFAMLGVVNYGTRTIAACAKDKEKRSVTFWNIYIFQLFLSVVAIFFYVLYLLFFCHNNYLIGVLQSLFLFGALVDVSWLYFGVEQFSVTVKRSVVVRIVSVVCILAFVKNPHDLWIYTMIMAGSTFVSNIILWRYLGKIVSFSDFSKIKLSVIMEHIKPNFILFIPIMAMSIFHIMDKTMLGLFSTYEQTGFYYNADKVINIPIGIINGIGTVMLPRMTALIESGKEDESTKVFNLSLEMIMMLSSVMAFGIAAISKEFTPLFFGKGFEPCIYLIILLTPVLIIKSMSQTSRMQFLIPQHREKIFVESVVAGAIVNFIVNIILIPKNGALGAVIGTVVAELVACVWQYVKMFSMINYIKTLYKSSVYIVFGIVMFFVVRGIAIINMPTSYSLCFEVLIGGSLYFALCVLWWGITKNSILNIIIKKRKIKKRRE